MNHQVLDMGYFNQLYFTSPSLKTNCMLQVEFPKGHIVPKFTNFFRETKEYTIKHIAQFQLQRGYISRMNTIRRFIFFKIIN